MKSNSIFFKKRELTQKKIVKSVNMPEDVEKDYNKHFKSLKPELINKKNGKLNDNQALLNLIIDYLNTKCLERKQYNIDVLINLNLTKKNVEILAVRNDYSIFKSFDLERKDNEFLTEPIPITNYPDFKNIYLKPKQEYFTHFYNNNKCFRKTEDIDTYIVLNKIENLLKDQDNQLFIIRLNNYLDEFDKGEFRAPNSEKENKNSITNALVGLYYMINYMKDKEITLSTHQSIAQIGNQTITFIWTYDTQTDEIFFNFKILTRKEKKIILSKTSNSELKNYFTIVENNTLKEEKNNNIDTTYNEEVEKKLEEIKRKYETKLSSYQKMISELIAENRELRKVVNLKNENKALQQELLEK